MSVGDTEEPITSTGPVLTTIDEIAMTTRADATTDSDVVTKEVTEVYTELVSVGDTEEPITGTGPALTTEEDAISMTTMTVVGTPSLPGGTDAATTSPEVAETDVVTVTERLATTEYDVRTTSGPRTQAPTDSIVTVTKRITDTATSFGPETGPSATTITDVETETYTVVTTHPEVTEIVTAIQDATTAIDELTATQVFTIEVTELETEPVTTNTATMIATSLQQITGENSS